MITFFLRVFLFYVILDDGGVVVRRSFVVLATVEENRRVFNAYYLMTKRELLKLTDHRLIDMNISFDETPLNTTYHNRLPCLGILDSPFR